MKIKWQKIKNQVLGEKFDLSVVFAEDALMRKLNKDYRKKIGTSNVLSFSISDSMGEIFINKKFSKQKDYVDYLFAHSILHLKGFKHSKKMEKEEDKLIKEFNLKFKI